MTRPATSVEARRAPVCTTCGEPMRILRAVTPAGADGLRVFQCSPCGVAMFTAIE